MSRVEIAFTGRLRTLPDPVRRSLLDRARTGGNEVAAAAASIIARVRAGGDTALQELAHELDRVELASIEVPRERWQKALEQMSPEVVAALERAADALRVAHRDQLPAPVRTEVSPGVLVGRRPVPLDRVGAYAPGGRAAYPSSVLMCAVPARVAGVRELVVCSPPGPDGLPSPAVQAACAVAGVDRLFALGGAGAIAAMAFGTETVPAVDRIVGPGNAWVEAAKQQVAGTVGIDCPAGPSEVLIVADADADAAVLAAELLAQAEHDPEAAVVLLALDGGLLGPVHAELERQLESLATAANAREALSGRGALLVCDDVEEAFAFAEAYAPEHLLLVGQHAEALADRLTTAGCVFVGASSSVSFGDYAAGSNHVLPTAGRARAFSGLGVPDFLRWVAWQRVAPSAAAELAPTVETLATLEGLPAHAAAARRAGGGGEIAAAGRLPREAPAARRLPQPTDAVMSVPHYRPGRRDSVVELSDNTNLFGPAPSARVLVDAAPDARLTRYPTVYGDELKAALAQWHGVTPDQVATGCGSDDILDSLLRAYARPGAALAHPDPTFSMIPIFARANGLRPVAVPPLPDLAPDLEAVAAVDALLTYACRPENPTGALPSTDALLELARAVSGIVLVDEAYLAFAGEPSLAAEAAASDNLVVMGTFSKAWGLAGLRIGYAVGPAAVIAALERARGPYTLNALAEAAAVEALRHDGEWMREIARRSVASRDRLAGELRRRGLTVWPSAGNFLLVGAPPGIAAGATGLAGALRERGVGVRPFPGLPVAGEAVRVGVGPWEVMERFLAALDEVLAATGRQS